MLTFITFNSMFRSNFDIIQGGKQVKFKVKFRGLTRTERQNDKKHHKVAEKEEKQAEVPDD